MSDRIKGMTEKQDILNEIRRTAKENGGRPLGERRFLKQTDIHYSDWGKYWARFGDAQKEAGFLPNQLQVGYTDEFLIEKIVGLARKLGKFPTYRDMKVALTSDPKFPSPNVFWRRGTKEQLAAKVIEYCKGKSGYDDVVDLCNSVFPKSTQNKTIKEATLLIGEVYLFKSGRYFKIGKSKDTVRRGSELRIQLPETSKLIHSIKTDDPSGIEAYWHKRFEAKRMQGEWFDLNTADVKAFKRWRKIV